jgi:hypothetical protein
MIRRDTALDADRPHYYSQFWIDVAAGKREIGGARPAVPEPEDEVADQVEAAEVAPPHVEVEPEPEPEREVPAAKAARPAKAKPEPKRPEPVRPALTSLADLAKIDSLMRSSAEMGDDTVPDIESAASAPIDEEAVVTDFDAGGVPIDEAPEPAQEEEEFADEFPEEFEEEDEWGEEEGPRRGSKANKRRREPRREF